MFVTQDYERQKNTVMNKKVCKKRKKKSIQNRDKKLVKNRKIVVCLWSFCSKKGQLSYVLRAVREGSSAAAFFVEFFKALQ